MATDSLCKPLAHSMQSAAALIDRLSTCCKAEKRSACEGGGGVGVDDDETSNDHDAEIASKSRRNVARLWRNAASLLTSAVDAVRGACVKRECERADVMSRYAWSTTNLSARCVLNGIDDIDVEAVVGVVGLALTLISSATADVACVNSVRNLKNNRGWSLLVYILSNEDEDRICLHTSRGVAFVLEIVVLVEEEWFLEQDAHALTALT